MDVEEVQPGLFVFRYFHQVDVQLMTGISMVFLVLLLVVK
jgi:hypothetical protein